LQLAIIEMKELVIAEHDVSQLYLHFMPLA
jgi:hypothetical protein